jgi:release factor glutamine methyltransferase
MPFSQGVAVDCSAAALAVARANAARLRLDRRVQFVESDLFNALEKDLIFDWIVSNPPYLRSGELVGRSDELAHEPRVALEGGARGTEVLERLIAASFGRLRPGGLLAAEIGFDQGAAARRAADSAGFTDVSIEKDLAGMDRMLLARR